MFWLYERSHGADAALDRAASFGAKPVDRRSATRARSRPATPSARRPRCSTPRTAWRRPSSRRARTATSPATRRPRSASWPRRELAQRELVYGSYPITPASDILHQLATYKNFGVKTFQAEDEIAAIGSAIGAVVRRRAGHDGTSGPGHRPQERGHRPRRDGRAAAGRRRRPARRAVHRHADQDRAGRPADGDVRPQRRLAGADRRAGHAGRLLRLRHRGVAPRAQVHDAGHLPVRRLPRQRRRAVADARRWPTCPTSRSTTTPTGRPSSPTRATRRRSRARGPSRARPASSTASAASRRRTSPATSATTRRTTTRCRSCARRRSPASPTTSRRWRSTARRRATC